MRIGLQPVSLTLSGMYAVISADNEASGLLYVRLPCEAVGQGESNSAGFDV